MQNLGPAAKQSNQKYWWGGKLHCKHFFGKLCASYKSFVNGMNENAFCVKKDKI